jgi:hypothetical protein
MPQRNSDMSLGGIMSQQGRVSSREVSNMGGCLSGCLSSALAVLVAAVVITLLLIVML